MGTMKISVELPAKLVSKIKLRAVKDGKKLNDVFAELIIRGLRALDAESRSATTVRVSSATMKKRRELINRFVTRDWRT